jgi:hypothetical protein
LWPGGRGNKDVAPALVWSHGEYQFNEVRELQQLAAQDLHQVVFVDIPWKITKQDSILRGKISQNIVSPLEQQRYYQEYF